MQRLWQNNTFSVDSDDVVVWERVVDTFDQLADGPRMACDFGNGPTRRDVDIKALAVYSARLQGEEDTLSRDLGHRQVRRRH